MSTQSLREELENHAKRISEANDVMPKSLSEHQNKVYNSCLDMVYLAFRQRKEELEALRKEIEGRAFKREDEGSQFNLHIDGYNQAIEDISALFTSRLEEE